MRSAADAAPSLLYLPDLAGRGESFVITGEEAHYLTRVVRAREGERVTATDGSGALATLLVEQLRPALSVRVDSRATPVPRPESRILCGAPEGERGDWLVEKLAELGVGELQPVDTERGRWAGMARSERWHRLTVAALRQSRSAWLMSVGEVLPLGEALDRCGEHQLWLADPEGELPPDLRQGSIGSFAAAVGPSGGFSDRERNAMQESGFRPTRLAAVRLRTETAALAVAAHWAARSARPVGGPSAPAS